MVKIDSLIDFSCFCYETEKKTSFVNDVVMRANSDNFIYVDIVSLKKDFLLANYFRPSIS